MKISKLIVLILSILFIVSCSTPDDRREVVRPLGAIIHQENPELHDISDTFTIKTKDNKYLLVYVNSSGNISTIVNLKINCNNTLVEEE